MHVTGSYRPIREHMRVQEAVSGGVHSLGLFFDYLERLLRLQLPGTCISQIVVRILPFRHSQRSVFSRGSDGFVVLLGV